MATSEFGKAFAAARKSGEKEFTFGGKQYNTRLKEETVGEKNAKEGMSMTRMDPEKGAEAKKKFELEGARDLALRRAEGERAVAAHKAKQKDEAEAAAAASLGGYKRGGSVKSSASRRGDGIASKGKTRGKLC
jgi:hypothetical protein